ncbi:hypothetical protein FRC02_006840 [Tulasnella sp. 418]|nr:hypothetical protein FRC02_006840 [Tulasnella sp. 418]
MAHLPKLPTLLNISQHIPGRLQLAYDMLNLTVNHCRSRIKRDEDDPNRLKSLRQQLFSEGSRVINAVKRSNLFSEEWVTACSRAVAKLRKVLLERIERAKSV